jgi:hypothetical protein
MYKKRKGRDNMSVPNNFRRKYSWQRIITQIQTQIHLMQMKTTKTQTRMHRTKTAPMLKTRTAARAEMHSMRQTTIRV